MDAHALRCVFEIKRKYRLGTFIHLYDFKKIFNSDENVRIFSLYFNILRIGITFKMI